MAQDRRVDLEAWETSLRAAALAAGARLLERLLAGTGCGRRETYVTCSCGQERRSVGLRSKRVETLLGPIQFRRSLFVCPGCGKSCFPGDQLLGIEDTCYSPGAKRMIARAGSRTSFMEAEEDLLVYAQL